MRILFVKTSSLGDVIHHCPAVSDARRRFPEAAIDWVVEEPFAGIVALHPGVRRVIPVAVRRWRTRLYLPSIGNEILTFRRALREERYDFVIDTQGLLKSAVIARGARGSRHGFGADSVREPPASWFYDTCHTVPVELHAVERNRMLTAAALGIESGSSCEYGLVPNVVNPIRLELPVCVLLSMTSRPDKLWPEAHWVELLQTLTAQGLECVLPWGSAAERARCYRIVARAGSGHVPSALSLGQLASMLASAHSVFGVDTGLAHLAAALGVPAIGLYSGTDPALTGLYGSAKSANLGGPGRTPSPGEAIAAMKALV